MTLEDLARLFEVVIRFAILGGLIVVGLVLVVSLTARKRQDTRRETEEVEKGEMRLKAGETSSEDVERHRTLLAWVTPIRQRAQLCPARERQHRVLATLSPQPQIVFRSRGRTDMAHDVANHSARARRCKA